MTLPRYWQRTLALIIFAFLGVSGYLFIYFPSHSTYTLPLTHEAPTTAGASTENAPAILLVSSFFPLAISKHSTEEYKQWFSLFLSTITTEVYFYTTPAWAEHIRSLRGSLPITINTTFSSPFDIPPLHGLSERYSQMHALDREKTIHGPELYAVWNAKAYFLDEGVRNTGGKWDYAFWNDAGSFRGGHEYRTWPHPHRVDALWEQGSHATNTRKEDLLFFPMANAPSSWSFKNWKESQGPIDTDFSEGSFFGGSPTSVAWFRKTFYAYHDHYLSKNLFVGKDQTVFNTLLFLFPSRFITTWVTDPNSPQHIPGLPLLFKSRNLGNCGNEWFYYQFFLASEEERRRMRKSWNISGKELRKWDKWVLKDGDLSCRLNDLLSIKDVLRSQFGHQWQAPASTVNLSSAP